MGATSIAFPAISTGVYGYPVAPATQIAIDTIRSTTTKVELVRFVCFNDEAFSAYEAAVAD